MSHAQTSIDRNNVPLQPGISRQLCYNERLLKWNPYSKKNLTLCYQFQTGSQCHDIRLIPDACIDFLFKCGPDAPSAVVSGIQTVPREVTLEPNATYFGFKPFSAKGMSPLPIPWRELTDSSVDMETLTGAGWVAELLSDKKTFDERIDAIADFALRLTDPDYTPDFIEYAELRLCQAKGNLRMEEISDYTGYTGRYCREKFKQAHGISIKSYSSIMRFQNVVRMLSNREKDIPMADIVFENGYFDQSHLNREFRRFSGDTPLRFRQNVLTW